MQNNGSKLEFEINIRLVNDTVLKKVCGLLCYNSLGKSDYYGDWPTFRISGYQFTRVKHTITGVCLVNTSTCCV